MSNMKDQIQKRADAIGKETAYPTTSEGAAFGTQGLTKLELFAAMAMQGLVSHGYCNTNDCANDAVEQAKALCIALAQAEMEGGQNG